MTQKIQNKGFQAEEFYPKIESIQQNQIYQKQISTQEQINTLEQNCQDQIYLLDVLELGFMIYPRQHIKETGKGLCKKYQKYVKTLKMTKSSQCCAICQQSFAKDQLIKKLPCKHIFHRACLKPWLNVNIKCPNCRLDLEKYFKEEEKEFKAINSKKNYDN